ncbi:uncharacterized protein N0V89_008384 [Didymosphaeria variabile]|uniref:Uncharacterized protein n=1 Tax=Didymosphaeria variabile TaxID=1932322 RepID=A0A9W8XFN0_9PLEO|nr:uncharacterized protein N0V89_008384 [Didymosphaeria variabile]KAJ4349766.1 hypothetical protein N0V89_008384 [Didymosphaeria variabile]
MSWLLTTATAEEARAKSGLNWSEWAKFYAFAKEEARRLASEHPEWNWTNVPAYEKTRVRESINGQLRREGISPLGEDIIRWRMSICIRDVKQWAVNKTCMPKRNSTAAVAAGSAYHQVPPSRPYDPVRDF